MKTKYAIFILFVLFAVVAVLFWPKNPEKKEPTDANIENIPTIKGLKTCPVCGYDALQEKGGVCQNCQFAINKIEADKEYLDDLNSLIIDRQISYFMPDTLGKAIDFLNPKISKDGYPKNPNWRPLVYESQIYEVQKMILDTEEMVSRGEENNKSPK